MNKKPPLLSSLLLGDGHLYGDTNALCNVQVTLLGSRLQSRDQSFGPFWVLLDALSLRDIELDIDGANVSLPR